jgi:hypothetical protein
MEFLYNIWLGVLENKDKILMVLTSGEFVGLIGLLTVIIKSNRKTTENTNTNKTLSNSVKDLKEYTGKLDGIKDDVSEIVNSNEKTSEQIASLDEKTDSNYEVLNAKVDAMLEVQSIVYASIKDERARTAISSILANAKYADCKTKEELKRQVEELKAEVNLKSKELVKLVEDRGNKVSAMVSTAAETESEIVERY